MMVIPGEKPSAVKKLLAAGDDNYKEGRYDEAISAFSRVVELCPDEIEALYRRGLAYKEKGEYQLALADFNHALEIDAHDFRVHCNKALVCERIGEYAEAVVAYRAFLKSAPAQYSDHLKFAEHRINELQNVNRL